MISTLLDRLFQRTNVPSGAQVKHRLKFILAHDRAAIEPQVFENMRQEIMRVVSKYVELDEATLDIRLESDKRMTALIANLPIRMVREDLPDLQAIFDETPEKSSKVDQPDALVIEMDLSAEAAFDAIAAKEITKPVPENIEPENIEPENIEPENILVVAERTNEVTSKLRTAVNKSPNSEISNDSDEVDTGITEQPIISGISAQSISITSNDAIENLTEEEQPSDQLELSLGVPHVSESQEVVIEESPEFYNKAQE